VNIPDHAREARLLLGQALHDDVHSTAAACAIHTAMALVHATLAVEQRLAELGDVMETGRINVRVRS
jgi:hypothetical protein